MLSLPKWTLLVVVAGALCVAFLRAPAAAQSNAADTVAQTEFDRVLKLALDEFDRGNWPEARSHFERAHELRPSARTLRAIAACAFEQRLYVDSIVYGQQALTDPRKPLDDKLRKEAEKLLERAYGFVAQLDLVLVPEEAQVLVDLKPPTWVAGKLLLDPGEHELQVTATGFEEAVHRFVAKPRESRTITIKLRPINAQPQAQIDATPSGEPTSSPSQAPDWALHRKVGISVGAVGLASLGASLAFALVAKSKHDDAGCTSAGCEDAAAKRLNDRAVTYANVSTATAVIGAASLGAGVAMFFWPAKWTRQGDVALKVAPALASRYSGASVEVVW
jgi:hypothetical protein